MFFDLLTLVTFGEVGLQERLDMLSYGVYTSFRPLEGAGAKYFGVMVKSPLCRFAISKKPAYVLPTTNGEVGLREISNMLSYGVSYQLSA